MYYTYRHIETSIISIKGLINEPSSILRGYAIWGVNNKKSYNQQLQELLNYDGGTGITNALRVYNKYSKNPDGGEQKKYKGHLQGLILDLIKPDTELLIPYDKCDIQILSISGDNIFVEQNDFKTFLSKQLYNIVSDSKYVSKETFLASKGYEVSEVYPKISIWCYSRSMNRVINLTPYIISLSINVSKSGGKFNFSIAPVNDLDTDSIYGNKEKITETYLYTNEKRDQRNNFFFHENISTNDVLFIKFEELSIKDEDRDRDGFYIDSDKIPNQIYDMIGLVDSNSISINPENNDISINISGRDLRKILTEDASVFMSLAMVEGSSDFFVNFNEKPGKDRYLKRFYISKSYGDTFLASNTYRSIPFTLQFYINQCSSLGIIPNESNLLEGYKDRRGKRYKINDKSEVQGQEPRDGLWQIIDLCVDESIRDRRINDNSVATPEGSIDSLFSKLCQDPFVEFFGDTYGDKYTLIVRQPPFTKEAILSYIEGEITKDNNLTVDYGKQGRNNLIIDIYDSDISSETLEFNEDKIYTWYKLDAKNITLKGQTEDSLLFLPIIYLPRYVDIWGNRPRQVVNTYINYEAIEGSGKDVAYNKWIAGGINDLKYLLDCETYLPFTRKGTITLMGGDRRIKIGTWIRHNGTKELYYVDAVNNDFSISNSSIDRTTTISVSRGMVEKYINHPEYSYFNIVNTETIKELLLKRSVSLSDTKVSLTSNVNDKVFDFFLMRRQFKYNGDELSDNSNYSDY